MPDAAQNSYVVRQEAMELRSRALARQVRAVVAAWARGGRDVGVSEACALHSLTAISLFRARDALFQAAAFERARALGSGFSATESGSTGNGVPAARGRFCSRIVSKWMQKYDKMGKGGWQEGGGVEGTASAVALFDGVTVACSLPRPPVGNMLSRS